MSLPVSIGKQVRVLAISPDGKTLYAGTLHDLVHVWDTSTRTCIQTLPDSYEIRHICLSSDGEWLYTAAVDEMATLWGTHGGSYWAWIQKDSHWIHAMTLSLDGKCLYIVTDNPLIRKWDVSSVPKIDDDRVATIQSYATALAVSSDSQRLYGLDGKTILVWDTSTYQQTHSWTISHVAHRLVVSHRGDRVYVGGFYENGTISVVDTTTGEVICTLIGHTDGVNALCISPDDKWLYSGSNDKTIRIWDTTTHTCLHILTGHDTEVCALAIHPSGHQLYSGGDDGIRVWDFVSFYHSGSSSSQLFDHSTLPPSS